MLGQLRSTAASGALKDAQFMAAATALAEALQKFGAHERRGLDVHITDAAFMVVRAKHRYVSITALHLTAGSP